MAVENFKLQQAQYARVYGVTDRSVRTYQKQGLPLDDPGKMSLHLLSRKVRPPGFQMMSPELIRLNYNREAGIETPPAPCRIDQLEELIFLYWEAANDIRAFIREHNLPNQEEIEAELSGVSTAVLNMRRLAKIQDKPAQPDETEDAN